jgi:hypothetical protein
LRSAAAPTTDTACAIGLEEPDRPRNAAEFARVPFLDEEAPRDLCMFRVMSSDPGSATPCTRPRALAEVGWREQRRALGFA